MKKTRKLSADADLSQSYAAPEIAEQQRPLVDQQLEEMRAGNPPRHFEVAGEIVALLKDISEQDHAMLLDAGCSSAYYHEIVEHYAPGWAEYVGVDYNSGMVEMARHRYPGLVVLQMDTQQLDARDRAFDVVLSSGTVNHVLDWQATLRELARVTDRWLILHRAWVYVNEWPTYTGKSNAYGQDVWQHRWNERELIEVIEGLGLNLVFGCDSGEGEGAPMDGEPEPEARGRAIRTYLFERSER